MRKQIITTEEVWEELLKLKLELRHKSINQTIQYLLYELNQPYSETPTGHATNPQDKRK